MIPNPLLLGNPLEHDSYNHGQNPKTGIRRADAAGRMTAEPGSDDDIGITDGDPECTRAL